MNKIATFLSEKLAGKLDDLAHRDMRVSPSITSRSALSEKKQEQMSDYCKWSLCKINTNVRYINSAKIY